jgi:hypothetical protein
MNLPELCDLIDLPSSARQHVLSHASLAEVTEAERHKNSLLDRSKWDEAVKAIAATIGDDPDGMKNLAFMLLRAVEARVRYQQLHIDDAIFADTFKFCSRFVSDHYQTYGNYAFTWAWWLPRQLSLNEFRFGTLEYELVETGSDRSASIHIPADARLRPQVLRHSLELARTTIARIAPDYADAPMICDSWMLSPTLRELLPDTSNILAFASGFDLIEVDRTNRHAIRWIYGRDDLPFADLAEGTSLQRATKALLLAGGNIGAAVGRLRTDAWADEPTTW